MVGKGLPVGNGFIPALIVLAVALLAAAAASASGPGANDNLANATDFGTQSSWADFGPIGPGVTSAEGGEDSHAGHAASESVWEKWTAPANAKVTVDSCDPTNNIDTVLEVYSGPAVSPTFSNITSLGDNDDGCGPGNGGKVSFAASAGTTYYVVVDRVSGGNTYKVALNTAPVNDDFSGSVLSGAPVSVNGTNAHATREPNEPTIAGQPGGASVWYSWTAPATASYAVQTCNANFDTLLAVYEPGAGGIFAGGISEVAHSDNDCGVQQSKLTLPATMGVTYYIAIDGAPSLGGAAEGDFRLDIVQAPANDDLTNATALSTFPVWPGTVLDAAANSAAATAQTNENPHATGQPASQSVWYRWTSPVSGPVTADTCLGSATVDTRLAVYADGTSFPLPTEIGSNNDSCGQRSKVRFTATVGTPYLIAIDSVGFGGPVSLDIHDATAPQTSITSLKIKRSTRRATLRFKGVDDRTDSGPIAFQCKIDKKAFSGCRSGKSYRLKKGRHTFQVRARDSAKPTSNMDTSPAVRKFRIR